MKPRIDDADFAAAIQAIDTGNESELIQLLKTRPDLLSLTAEEDGSFAGDYFKNPRLIWFVAENPIRNERLPPNIANITSILIEWSKRVGVPDLIDQLNYTLALTTSSKVARESGLQTQLCRAIIEGGADPNSGITSALAHGETHACEILLDCGAELTLPLAAGLGKVDDVTRLKKSATPPVLQEALIMAAINGQHECASILADSGTDLNAFNPTGLHAHSTPLHQAVQSGCVRTVCHLVTRGANFDIKDKIFSGNADDWARECGHEHIQKFLSHARQMMPAVSAIRSGDLATLDRWLAQHKDRVNDRLGDNPRTLLHFATDWPGHFPNSGLTISKLIAAGANVNAVLAGKSVSAPETPLHWAASSNDRQAARALLDGGAQIDATGGCINNGTPLTLAVIFQNWDVAELLVDRGATLTLPLAAGMGDLSQVLQFFNDEGNVTNPIRSSPHVDDLNMDVAQLNGALCCAAMAGHLEIVQLMLDKGADINAKTSVPTTALDEACNNGHDNVANYLRSRGACTWNEISKSDR